MDDFFDSLAAPTTTTTSTTSGVPFIDPAADFLAQEQAELEKIGIDFNDQKQVKSNDNEWIVVNDQQQQKQEQQTSKITDLFSMTSAVKMQSQESDKLRQWKEEQKQRLDTKDAEEEKKKKELKENARKELEDWYQNRREQLEKTHLNNKALEIEQNKEAGTSGLQKDGHEWERVSKLCDFNTKFNKGAKDVSRMRGLLLQLKQQPLIR